MKNYLITGASSNLGKVLANHLSKNRDNKLIITSRKTVDLGIDPNENVKYLPGIDLLNEADLKIISDTTNVFFEGQFSVIHCTGYYEGQEPLEHMRLSESTRIFESNFTTVYNLTTQLLSIMIEKGGGHFIGFSCNSVKYNYPQMAPFTAAKAALESLFKTIANEFYDRGIYANNFQLATLLTEHEIKIKPHGDHKKWLKTIEVVNCIEQFINQPYQLQNGNTIQLYHYSESFFGQSYFDRISREI